MRRDELQELHYITPIANIRSILSRGILSNRRVAKLAHQSVAMAEIQDRRDHVVIPGGRPLHDYVNLYVCARNPMLFKRLAQRETLTVLRTSPAVLDLPDVVIADRNASSGYVRFAPSPAGLELVDRELVFAEYWTHPNDLFAEWEHKSIKCAEVLVPDRVDPRYIIGAYVCSAQAEKELRAVASELQVDMNRHLFFR